MKALVIGLGSMGKRRIRCLKALGVEDIRGFDLRADRRAETEGKYAVGTFGDFKVAMESFCPEVLIISVPPDAHHIYMKAAVAAGLHFFVEASVVDTDMASLLAKLKGTPLVAAPSATMLFHPGIRMVGEILAKGRLGKLSSVQLHSGQYLPDWHTYERVDEYYVSNPATGGAREIVPFEMTWLCHMLGFPKRVAGVYAKTIDIVGAERIDDTYSFLMDYGGFLASVTVDVVSRHATRRLLINGDASQLVWDWDENQVRIFDPEKGAFESLPYEMKSAEPGYNPNIGENMYIQEIHCFLEAVAGKAPYISTLERDHEILKLLYAIEESSRSSAFIKLP